MSESSAIGKDLFDALAKRSPLAQSRFREQMDWLSAHCKQWSESTWRVALVGVTSSGKSTLVNALLGETLVPVAVAPSSNTLICCRRGPRTEATVFWKDGRRAPEVVTESVAARVGELADESRNPQNREAVDQIAVVSPTFQLGENIELVDSPGLDAWGREDHERLTLMRSLPAADLVVYVTTTSCNSDAQTRAYIEEIARSKKPLIVVQNMSDKVGESIGRAGVVVHSRERNLAKHVDRLRGILDEVSEEAGLSPIVQVAAKEALSGATGSGVGLLVDTVRSEVARLAPAMERGRLTQLLSQVNQMSALETGDEEERAMKIGREEIRLRRLGLKLHNEGRRFDESATLVARECEDESRALRSRWNRTSLSRSEVEEAKAAIAKWRKGVAAKVRKLTDHTALAYSEIAVAMNLPPEDFEKPKMRHAIAKSLRPDSREQRRKRSDRPVARKGLWGWILDCFSTRRVAVPDIVIEHYRIPNLESVLEAEMTWLKATLGETGEGYRMQHQRLENELSRRERELEDGRAHLLQPYERDLISASLSQLRGRIEESMRNLPDRPTGSRATHVRSTPNEYSTAKVLTLTYHAGRLAQLLSERRLVGACDTVLRRLHGDDETVVLWGWDAGALTDCAIRFFAAPPEARPGTICEWTRDERRLRLAIVDETASSLMAALWGEIWRNEGAKLLIVVDASQSGAAASLLSRSTLLGRAGRRPSAAVVLQSLGGSAQDDGEHVAELLRELCGRVLEPLQLEVRGVLASHPDVRISALIDTLLYGAIPLQTKNQEQQCLLDLKLAPRLNDVPTPQEHKTRQVATQLLRAWKEQPFRPYPRKTHAP